VRGDGRAPATSSLEEVSVPSTRRIRTASALVAVALSAAVAVLAPSPSSAQEDPEEQREAVRDRQSEVAAETDVLEARNSEVVAAIEELQGNVERQQDALTEAVRASDAADEDVAEADAAVEQAEADITALEQAADDVVTEAFMNGPSVEGLDALAADTLSDAAVQQALLDMQADNDADLLDRLAAAREDLGVVQDEREVAAADAAAAEEEADNALSGLETALAEQEAFATEIEDAIDRNLIEAENLRQMDADLSREIERRAAERAAQLEALRQAEAARLEAAAGTAAAVSAPAGGGGSTISSSGSTSTVSCPNGGSITVASSIGEQVRNLMSLAGSQGVDICGWGWRDPEQQIQLRREHCGTSNYAIYEMPSSQCSPPTARPGRSMHEQGLAIDFNCNGGGSVRRGNTCWNFLAAHANAHGLYNLPSEPWHWSTNGN
jgi:septal ring factor EnvC (AmiA/AmiB activator)